MDLPDNTTIGDLIETITKIYPDTFPPSLEIVTAVNTNYATKDFLLSDGDEVAFIPPVSGGK